MYMLLMKDVGSRSIDRRCPVGVQGREEELVAYTLLTLS